jgi:hypothetical protein
MAHRIHQIDRLRAAFVSRPAVVQARHHDQVVDEPGRMTRLPNDRDQSLFPIGAVQVVEVGPQQCVRAGDDAG